MELLSLLTFGKMKYIQVILVIFRFGFWGLHVGPGVTIDLRSKVGVPSGMPNSKGILD